MQTQTTTFDTARSEAFSERLVEILNSGGITLMISIGHRTRLFDTMAEMNPATSAEIADKADLNERYVREWLGAMVAGRIVEFDDDAKHYYLPAEHAAWLTRKASPENIAVPMQIIGQLGAVEDRIVECFKHGGGVAYDEFTHFHTFMAEDSGQTVVAALTDHILPLAPGVVEALDRGIRVLDVGCGKGRALTLLAQTYPNSEFVGIDLCEEPVNEANAEVKRLGLDNIRFVQRDATDFDEKESYELVTAFDAIHDQAHPDRVLSNIYAALKPDGIFLMQDIAASTNVKDNIDNPIGAFIYTVSCMHCMTVSLAQNGKGLGAAWGKELAVEMLNEAGFDRVKVTNLPHDIQNLYFIAAKN